MPDFRPYDEFPRFSPQQSSERAREIHEYLSLRRTVRSFSSRAIPKGVLDSCLLAAGTAPSGAHKQPWHFVVVTDPALKTQVRQAAEVEEHAFYHQRAPQDWLDALAPFATNESKPFLEEAPALIAVFAKNHDLDAEGEKSKNYYVTESVGIATGFLIAALHWSGLACLTHTPSPMSFLHQLLERPRNERAFLLLVVGYPADGVEVPVLERKTLEQFTSYPRRDMERETDLSAESGD